MANLQVKIYQAKNNASTFTGNISEVATSGVIVFDEYTQQIGINGKWFGLDTKANYDSLKTLVTTTDTTLNGSVAKKIYDALSTALGTLSNGKVTVTGTGIDLGTGVTEGTVKEFLTKLQTEISANTTAIGSAITNLPNSYVSRESGTNKTDFATTTAIQTAIDTARTGAVSDVVGNGAVSTQTSELDPNTVWLKDEEKTLSHLKELINSLGGTDLANVQAAITAIKKELKDGTEAGDLANTLIDKLNTFLGSVTSWDVDGDNTNNATTVAQIIADLKTYASNAAAGVVGASNDASNANTVYGAKAYATNAAAGVVGTSNDTSTANTVYGAKAYADSVAGSVVSWTVVTGNES